jgi:hypothetical protein
LFRSALVQDFLLGNFDRWHETAVVRFLATSSAALVRNWALCVARTVRVLQAVLGFFEFVIFQEFVLRRARNLLCPAVSKSEIPRRARNDKF